MLCCNQAAEQEGQCVIVCCHLPLYPDTCPPACLVWNYEDVLAALHKHPGVVVATIAGHTHQNGYLVDAEGIHHMVLPGVVETAPGRDAYGVVEVYEDRLLLKGVDICMSCTCKLTAAAVQRQQQAAACKQPSQQQQQQEVQGGGSRSCESDIVVDVADADAADKVADAVAGIRLEAAAVAGTSLGQ